jgi:N-acetyl-1-D-myo-inositol-2-amino-2-deoxy-alpha-D-glucopyranoside deacetylase
MPHTLLVLFAHPDDESFAVGGTMAHYARQGVRVVLGTATRGEAGITHDEGAGHPADMGQVREEELRCACRTLGVHELRLLGYRDSGMAGDPQNDHPNAFCHADPERVVGQILDLFREFQPEVVLTFGPEGGYGHPDHLAIHRHTTAAWEQAEDLAVPPRKLYYTAISAKTFIRLRKAMYEAGLISEMPSEAEIARRGAPEDAVTTTIDIRDTVEQKVQALRCHRTQLAPTHPWLNLPLEFSREHMGHEYFALAATRGGIEIQTEEKDLFRGI